jgi:hypothetical protein
MHELRNCSRMLSSWQPPSTWTTFMILSPLSESFKPFTYTHMEYNFVSMNGFRHFVYFCSCFLSRKQNFMLVRCSITTLENINSRSGLLRMNSLSVSFLINNPWRSPDEVTETGSNCCMHQIVHARQHQSRNNVVWRRRHLVGLLWQDIVPLQGLFLHWTTQALTNVDAYPCLKRDSHPWCQCAGCRRHYIAYAVRPLWPGSKYPTN